METAEEIAAHYKRLANEDLARHREAFRRAQEARQKRAPVVRVGSGTLVRLARRTVIALVLPLSLAGRMAKESWRCIRNLPAFIAAGWSAEVRAAKRAWRV